MTQDHSIIHILLVNLPMFGIGFCFSIYCTVNQPFLNELKLSPQLSILVQAIGPVCAFFTQPLVGYYTDQKVSIYGIRKVGLLLGTVLAAFSQLWLAYSMKISSVFYTNDNQIRIFAQIWCIIGVVIFNVSINIEMASFYSLISVNLSKKDLYIGIPSQVALNGLSNMISTTIILCISSGQHQLVQWLDLYPIMAPLACIVGIFSVIPTLILIDDQQGQNSYNWQDFILELRNSQKVFYLMFIVVVFDWLAFTPNQMFLGTMYSLEQTNICFLSMNSVMAVSALFLPIFVKKFGERITQFIAGSINFTAVLILFVSSFQFAKNVYLFPLIVFCHGLTGILSSCSQSLHLIIIGVLAPQKYKGLYIGTFNCAIVIGQVIDSGLTSALSIWLKQQAGFYISFIFGFILVFISFLVIRSTININIDQDEQNDQTQQK